MVQISSTKLKTVSFLFKPIQPKLSLANLSPPQVLYEQMPVIYIYAINTTAGKDSKLYECPIYRYSAVYSTFGSVIATGSVRCAVSKLQEVWSVQFKSYRKCGVCSMEYVLQCTSYRCCVVCGVLYTFSIWCSAVVCRVLTIVSKLFSYYRHCNL